MFYFMKKRPHTSPNATRDQRSSVRLLAFALVNPPPRDWAFSRTSCPAACWKLDDSQEREPRLPSQAPIPGKLELLQTSVG